MDLAATDLYLSVFNAEHAICGVEFITGYVRI